MNKEKNNTPKNITKEECRAEFKRIEKQFWDNELNIANIISRDTWVRESKISVNQVNKLYGSWGNFALEMKGKPAKNSNNVKTSAGLTFEDKYVYNKTDGKYIFLLEDKIGKNIVLDKDKVKNITKAYTDSTGEQNSINQISLKFDIPRNYLTHIFKALGLTHDSLPVLDEELLEKDDDKIVEEILQDRKFAVYQKLQKKEWTDTKAAAEKWEQLEKGSLTPLKEYIDGIKDIRPLPEIKINKDNNGKKSILLGLNDLHIGSLAQEKYMMFGKEWNSDIAIKALTNLTEKVIKIGKEQDIKDVYIIFNGDHSHSITGETYKGTKLKCDTLHDEQFDKIIQGIRIVLDNFLLHFDKVTCYTNYGNHDKLEYYSTFKVIEQMYKDNKRFSINISLKDYNYFVIHNSLFICTHGNSPEYDYKTPKDKKGRKELGLRMIRLAEKELGRTDFDRCYLIKADTHAFVCEDLGIFTFYVFGALPYGCEYASALHLESTPCQNALIVSDSKDYQTIHIT